MSNDNGRHASENDPVEIIERDLERTRAELAETVDRLADKLDVPSRAKERLEDGRDRAAEQALALRDAATDDQGRPTPTAWTAVGGVVAGLAALVAVTLWRRRRS
ncbi:DUF3618 domain-containing protein [Nocardioides sp. BGMRC 2183]|nr:DUF3618 domain-containing protein [Nocardioides sp. BGMRC 2183]